MKNFFRLLIVLGLAILGPLTVHAEEVVKGKILIVASSTDSLELKDGKSIPTGFFLNELALPALHFIKEGYEVVVATPSGKKPVMDEKSKDLKYFNNDAIKFGQAVNFIDTHPSMQNPQTLKETAANPDEFKAVYVPGGHAPMNDLMQDPDLGKILQHFHANAKPTAFLCHGPIATLSTLPDAEGYREAFIKGDIAKAKELSQNWSYAGYKMTIFSNEEEQSTEVENLKGPVPFYVADALTPAGGKVENAPKFQDKVVQDRELITGQNPASEKNLAEAVVKAIEKGNDKNEKAAE